MVSAFPNEQESQEEVLVEDFQFLNIDSDEESDEEMDHEPEIQEDSKIVPPPGEDYSGEIWQFFDGLSGEYFSCLLKYFLDSIDCQGRTWEWVVIADHILMQDFPVQEMTQNLSEWNHLWCDVINKSQEIQDYKDFLPVSVIRKIDQRYILCIEDPHQIMSQTQVLFEKELSGKEVLSYLDLISGEQIYNNINLPVFVN